MSAIRNQRYEPTGQAPAGVSPQGAGNEPKEIQSHLEVGIAILSDRVGVAYHRLRSLEMLHFTLLIGAQGIQRKGMKAMGLEPYLRNIPTLNDRCL
jgi:hypothetical protein